MRKWLARVAALILLVTSVFGSFWLRRGNPEMTEIQLLIAFWPVWTYVAVTAAIILWLSRGQP